MYRNLLSLFLVLCASASFAQVQWIAIDSTSAYTYASIVHHDASNNVFVQNTVYGMNKYLQKYSPSGTLLWQQSIGQSADTSITDMIVDNASNIYVTGHRYNSATGTSHSFLKKIDNNGNHLWRDTTSVGEYLRIAVDDADNVYVCGIARDTSEATGMMLSKYSPAGVLLWHRDLRDSAYSSNALMIGVTKTGKIIIAGHEGGSWDNFGAIAQYDTDGNLEWRATLDIASGTGYSGSLKSIAVDDSGNLFVVYHYYYWSQQGKSYGYLAKITPAGQLSWWKDFIGFYYPEYNALATDSAGDLYLAGADFNLNTYTDDASVVKYDGATGQIIWRSLVSGTTQQVKETYNAIQVKNGALYATGSITDKDILTAKHDLSTGVVLWSATQNGTTASPPNKFEGTTITVDNEGSVIAAGMTAPAVSFESHSFVIKYNTAASVNDGGVNNVVTSVNENMGAKSPEVSHYPNPFSEHTTFTFHLARRSSVTLEVFDRLGKRVDQIAVDDLDQGVNSIQWNAKGMAAGMYFYRLTVGDKETTGKMVITR